MSLHDVLFVDDEENVLSGYKRTLRKKFNITTKTSGHEALKEIKERKTNPFAVAVVDMRMPEMDGLTLLKELKKAQPNTVRIMLTGNADQQTAADAINHGHIFRFLTKPCPPETMELAIKAGIRQHQLLTAEKELLEMTLSGSVKVMFDILSMVNPEAFRHASRIKNLAIQIAKSIGIEDVWKIELAAILSHVGALTVPQEILDKAWKKTPLSVIEQEIYNRIPQVNCELLKNIPRLGQIIEIVRYLNKDFNGEGVPKDDIKGQDIPFEARLIRIIADFVDLVSYHPPSVSDFEVLQRNSQAYDPELLQRIKQPLITFIYEREKTVKSKTEEISVNGLSAGQVLMTDIKRVKGPVLLTAGQKLTTAHVRKIKNLSKMFQIEEPVKVRTSDIWDA